VEKSVEKEYQQDAKIWMFIVNSDVGILSPRFTHNARSQEHKVYKNEPSFPSIYRRSKRRRRRRRRKRRAFYIVLR